MIRRHRRVVPATIVAVVVLAVMVLLVVSCVQLLLGGQPLIPFSTLATSAAGLQWGSVAVIAAGAVLLVLGVVLLACAWTRGKPTVIALAPTQDSTAGTTVHGLRRTLAQTARRVDGVRSATTTVTPKKVSATVTTPLRTTDGLDEQVRTAIGEQLSAIALDRPPRIAVRVTTARRR